MPAVEPNPQLWTIRFKQHKTTVLLFVQQTESFTSIKFRVLEALKERGYTGLNGNTLPQNSEDIDLGVPIDKNDLSKGWVQLDIPAMEIEDGNGGRKKIGGKDSVLNASPLGAGLRDGAILAFKWQPEGVKMDKDSSDGSNWDVIVPTYEDDQASQG
ncbi:hypothetical protein MMC13_004895 [Lambiella insularis]|nr:hypothetical protein [Lambiella insularis]